MGACWVVGVCLPAAMVQLPFAVNPFSACPGSCCGVLSPLRPRVTLWPTAIVCVMIGCVLWCAGCAFALLPCLAVLLMGSTRAASKPVVYRIPGAQPSPTSSLSNGTPAAYVSSAFAREPTKQELEVGPSPLCCAHGLTAVAHLSPLPSRRRPCPTAPHFARENGRARRKSTPTT